MSSNNNEMQDLTIKQSELQKHETIIRTCLKIIKEEKHKLQIEHLQLESMIDNIVLNSKKRHRQEPSFQPMIFATAENVNKQEVHLEVNTTLNRMVCGNFCTENVNEEEEEEEEEEHEEEEEEEHEDEVDEQGTTQNKNLDTTQNVNKDGELTDREIVDLLVKCMP